MTAPLRPGWRGRLVAVALCVLAAGLFAVGLNAPSAGAQTSRNDTSDVRITLVSQTPHVAAGQDLVLNVRIEGARPTDEFRFTVWQAAERDQLRAVRDATADADLLDEDLVRLYARTVTEPYEQLVDSRTGLVAITIPPHASTASPGVYPVTVSVKRGTAVPSEPKLTTTLVRTGTVDAEAGPLSVALVVPWRAQVAHHLDGTVAIDPEERARLVALLDLASRHPEVPFTFEPAPETLDALDQGSADDRALLDRIGSATRGVSRLGGPYVSLDEEAMRSAGLGLAVTEQHSAGIQTLETLLGEVDTSISRTDPTDTPSTLSLRRSLGSRWFLIDDRWLEPLDDDSFPATMLQSFVVEDAQGLTTPAAAIDGTLADLAGRLDDSNEESDRPRLLQQFVADLAAGYADDPDEVRSTVVAVPDDWDPRVARADDLLSALTTMPQLRFVTLTDALSTMTVASPLGSGRTQTTQNEPLQRSLRSDEPADLAAYAGAYQRTARHLRGLHSIAPDAATAPVNLDHLLLVSADDRLTDDERFDVLGAVDDLVEARLNPEGTPAFVGPGRQRVTMTSRGATIPIQIENRLGVAANVRIELRSEKLNFPQGSVLTPRTLAPGANTIEVDVEAKVSGDSILEVNVLPPDTESGLGSLSTGTFTVRATALSGVGVVLSVLAVLVLCVWWGRHVLRTRRERAASTRPPGTDEASDDHIDGDTAAHDDAADPSLTPTES